MQAKKNSRIVTAYPLNDMACVQQLISKGLICQTGNGYRVFSRESPREGELANKEDYVLIDNAGFPYINQPQYFKTHYTATDEPFHYRTVPVTVDVWQVGQPESEAVRWLLENERLHIHFGESYYYSAFLYGTLEKADKDAFVIIYSVDKEHGQITDVSFNLIAQDEFLKNYTLLSQPQA